MANQKITQLTEVTAIGDMMLPVVNDQAGSPVSRKGALKTTTFTPAISGLTTAGVGTYTSQQGRYTKLIDIVFFKIELIWTAHTGTGNMAVTGLPFTARNDFNQPIAVYYSDIALTAVGNKLLALLVVNTSRISLLEVSNGAAAALAIEAAGTLRLQGAYWL
jgi:hypothetical protein